MIGAGVITSRILFAMPSSGWTSDLPSKNGAGDDSIMYEPMTLEAPSAPSEPKLLERLLRR